MMRPVVIVLVLYLLAPVPAAGAQILRINGGDPAYWMTGGAGYLSHGRVHDGATQSRWDFAGGFQWRGSIEREIQRGTSIGLMGTWARLPLRYHSLDGSFPSRDATANVWSLAGAIHAGGGEGFHQVIQILAGVTGFSNFRDDASGEQLAAGGDRDFMLSIGYGFGYSFGQRTQINLVQDYAYVFHQRAGLPGDVSGRVQTSTLRLAFRYGVGRRGF